jgi:hypothetical protein
MKPRWRVFWASLITAVIVAVVTAVVTVVTTGLFDNVIHPFKHPQKGVVARIINTNGQGVFYYQGPRIDSGHAGGVSEGKTVRVVCQVRNGQPTTDTAGRTKDQPPNWPVWDKTTDGRYFPDTWSDLPKQRGPTPPRGIRIC